MRGRPGQEADIDLVVATLGRDRELAALLASVREQELTTARVILVDQNQDDRIGTLLEREPDVPEVLCVKTTPGVSLARNCGSSLATAPLVAWPDDDCVYPSGLLRYVLAAFADDPALDVLVGRTVDPSGLAGPLPTPSVGQVLDSRSLWRFPSAPTFFARRRAVGRVGDWSTEFGPGGTSRWDAGEDTDWLIRAVQKGLCVRFDPLVTVLHRDPFRTGSKEASRRARRYGRCTVAVALSNGYRMRFVIWLVVRAAGGAVVSVATGRFARAAIHFQAMVGRIEGLVLFRLEPRSGDGVETPADASRSTRPRR